MPVYPVARGESRLYMQRIEKDWYSLMNTIQSGTAAQADAARKQLREELLAIAPVFTQKPYFLSDEFSTVDCYRRRCCGVCRFLVWSWLALARKSSKAI